jgi:hypothetical protein
MPMQIGGGAYWWSGFDVRSLPAAVAQASGKSRSSTKYLFC